MGLRVRPESSRNSLRLAGVALTLLVLLHGCGSCGRAPESTESGGGAAGGRPESGVPALRSGAAESTKGRIAAPTPAAANPFGAAPGAAAPPAQEPAEEPPAEEPAGAEQAPQGDCVVIIDAEPDFGAPPLSVSFSVEAQCTGGTPTYSWDFGDNSAPSSDSAPAHVYEKPGEFTVTLRAVGPDGTQASDDIDITVEEDVPE